MFYAASVLQKWQNITGRQKRWRQTPTNITSTNVDKIREIACEYHWRTHSRHCWYLESPKQGWDLSLWLRHGNQTTIIKTQELSISESKESKTNQKHDYEHTYCSSTFIKLCGHECILRVTPSMPSFTTMFWIIWRKTLSKTNRSEMWYKNYWMLHHYNVPQS